jgi:hypothetical protein
MNWKKWAVMWAVAMIVGLYTTFVLQNLWNWFAVGALHVSEVSFWMMYGLAMLIHAVFKRNEEKEEAGFKHLGILLNACVPEEKRSEVREEIESEEKSLPLKIGLMIAGQILDNSLTLGLGWAIHTFLA